MGRVCMQGVGAFVGLVCSVGIYVGAQGVWYVGV